MMPDSPYPLGSTVYPDGVNFSVFSKDATRIDLLLFDSYAALQPSAVIPFDPFEHRTYHYWHRFVPNLRAGQVDAYRAHGPFEPDHGLRLDPEKVLIDPYGIAVLVPHNYDRSAAMRQGDNTPTAMKSVVACTENYDGKATARFVARTPKQ